MGSKQRFAGRILAVPPSNPLTLNFANEGDPPGRPYTVYAFSRLRTPNSELRTAARLPPGRYFSHGDQAGWVLLPSVVSWVTLLPLRSIV
jgi:hypothetical protein